LGCFVFKSFALESSSKDKAKPFLGISSKFVLSSIALGFGHRFVAPLLSENSKIYGKSHNMRPGFGVALRLASG
jgi:hypothetical protein